MAMLRLNDELANFKSSFKVANVKSSKEKSSVKNNLWNMPTAKELETVIESASIKVTDEQQEKRLQPLYKIIKEVEGTYKASKESNLRDYKNAPQSVKNFYRKQRRGVTAEMTLKDRKAFTSLKRGKLSMWGLVQRARKYADGSDPDHIKAQLLHLYGAAEKAQQKKMPNWFVLTCLIHDGGKFLMKWIPEHRVVGDTFPHLVKPQEKEIFFEEFKHNKDWNNKSYQGKTGAYKKGCGIDNLLICWGHDEYLFQILFNWLKQNTEFVKKNWKCTALEIRLLFYMVRFHSFYAFHREGAYKELWSKADAKLRPFLRVFSMFDLYSKPDKLPPIKELDKKYKPLVEKFFPGKLMMEY